MSVAQMKSIFHLLDQLLLQLYFFPLDLFSCKNVEWVFLMLSAIFLKFLFHHLIVPPSLCFFAAKFLELEKNAFMRNILPFDVLVLCVPQLVCIFKLQWLHKLLSPYFQVELTVDKH